MFHLRSAVNVIWVSFFTGVQRHMGDVLHWVGQGQQNLTLLYYNKTLQLLTNEKKKSVA